MNSEKRNSKHLIIYAIVSFVLVFLISFFVLFFIENQVRNTKIEELKKQEKSVVQLEKDFLGREFSMLLSDLHYLHHAYQEDLFEAEDFSKVSINWKEFSTQRRVYDQIRFIDANGQEKVRINNVNEEGYIVPNELLQNKKDRYYFTETKKLEEGKVYFSPLDLNIENGEIESPHKPMIRISTPIYDEEENFQGIIVLNYLAEYILTPFRELASNSQGEIILLNESGYRLSSNNKELDFNFMFDEKKEISFAKEYPKEWEKIREKEDQNLTDIGLITSKPVILKHRFNIGEQEIIDPNIVLGDINWYVVSVVENSKNNKEYFLDNKLYLVLYVFRNNVFYFLLISLVSSIVGFLVYINRKTYSKIKYYSEIDPLTKTLNRRSGISKLNELFPTDERRRFLVSLCFIDINDLKEVNDNLGHKSGDELIKSVADIIKETIRKQDFLIRLGGDEFLIVFNEIGIDVAESIWQRITNTYKKINENEDRPYIISVSHGIVDFDNRKRTQVDELINAADEKMYSEKQIIKKDLSVIKRRNDVHRDN